MPSARVRIAPADVLALIRDQLEQIGQNDNGGLLTVGLIGTIWSASSGMSSTMSTLNQAYHVTERRSWWRVRLTAILLTAALATFVLISFALVLVGPAAAETIASKVGLGPVFTWSWEILQWPIIVALIMTALVSVYYIGPDVQQQCIWVMPGAVVGTFLWLSASLGLKWYISEFANYQKTYGAIGGAMVTLATACGDVQARLKARVGLPPLPRGHFFEPVGKHVQAPRPSLP